jgi:hypothetical protein
MPIRGIRACIDLPQRFGPDPLTEFHWGQSLIGLRRWGLVLAYGTANQWWGPARHNPLIMSTNAPGFPHLSLGTDTGYRVPGGWLDFTMLWGTLRESKWLDEDPETTGGF